MLILSRRQNERVNFPALGITVEVLSTGSKKVQLGIDAPPEIRVIRDEMNWHENRPIPASLNQSDIESIRDELHNAAVAIRLSQNQMNHGRRDIAEKSLEDAIGALLRLENQIAIETPEMSSSVVRESGSNYSTLNPETFDQLVTAWHQQYFQD